MRIGGGGRDPVGLRKAVEDYKRMHTVDLNTFKTSSDADNDMGQKDEQCDIEHLKMKQRDGMNMRVIANANPPK